MRIKALTTLQHPAGRENDPPGTELEMDDAEAKRLIGIGAAEEVKPPPVRARRGSAERAGDAGEKAGGGERA